MNSLRLPGRLENPRSCSHLSPLFLFYSSPFARVPLLSRPLSPSPPTPLSGPVVLSFEPARSRSLSVVRELFVVVVFRLLCSDIPLIFLSRSHSLTISFYSFCNLADQLRKLLKPLVAVENYLLSSCRSIVRSSSSSSVVLRSFHHVNIPSKRRCLSPTIGVGDIATSTVLDSFRLSYPRKRKSRSEKSRF